MWVIYCAIEMAAIRAIVCQETDEARRVTTSASFERLIKLCRRFGWLKGGKDFRQPSATRWPFDAKLLHPVNQSSSLEAKLCGGTIASSNDPTGGLKRPKNERSFGVAERHGDSGRRASGHGHRRYGRRCRCADRECGLVGWGHSVIRHNHSALDEVLKLAYVSGPGIRLECCHRFF